MNVSAWCIKNPIPSVMLFVMLTLAGLLGFSSMKVQQFPDIDLPTISVTASLPGTAPAQMETEVARKLENAVAALQGVKNIYTKVQDGVAIVTVEFRLEKPTQEALDDVRSAVSRVRSDLPAELRDPVISKLDLAGAPILTYTVASNRMAKLAADGLDQESGVVFREWKSFEDNLCQSLAKAYYVDQVTEPLYIRALGSLRRGDQVTSLDILRIRELLFKGVGMDKVDEAVIRKLVNKVGPQKLLDVPTLEGASHEILKEMSNSIGNLDELADFVAFLKFRLKLLNAATKPHEVILY
jgi:Cu/Ag efflux pump CusA